MRSKLSFVTAALCAAAFSPAAAQRVAAAEYVRPAVAPASADAALIRTVAIYHFDASRVAGIPSEVTVADSAGTLIASFRLPGIRQARTMMVDVLESDLLLQGATPSGVLTLLLRGANESGVSPAIVGQWTVGSQQGELRGRAAH